ncbi:MAG: hypothetical protein GX349_00720 [Firmicutes bacterium]|nr:hypothetical protein [Bacillota bacterium]
MQTIPLTGNIRRHITLFFLLLFLLLMAIYTYWRMYPPLGPEEIVQKALANLEKAQSYTYNLNAVSLIQGQESLLTQVEGAWKAPDSHYIKGETLGNTLEAYIIADNYMIKDPQGDWLEFRGGEGPSLLRETVLFSQTPLRDLHGFHSGQIAAEKTVAGRKCYVLTGRLTRVSNPLWQAFWQDFTCQLWIDKKELFLRQLWLAGVSIGSEDRLTVFLELADYDAQLTIIPPLPKDKQQ